MSRTPEPHDRHDRHLVAALAADDLEPIVRSTAESLVASCRECADLLADLRLIATATAALPPVPRTRDFRISAADAARLRPTGWRGLLDAIAGARASFSRPLAVGLTTLGLVGLLATTIPGALGGLSLGSGAAAPLEMTDTGRTGQSFASAAPAVPGASVADAGAAASTVPNAYGPSAAASAPAKVDRGSPASNDGVSVQAVGSAAPGVGGLFGVPPAGTKGGGRSGGRSTEASGSATDLFTSADHLSSTTTGPPLLLLASLACLIAGLGLFFARWSARRLARR